MSWQAFAKCCSCYSQNQLSKQVTQPPIRLVLCSRGSTNGSTSTTVHFSQLPHHLSRKHLDMLPHNVHCNLSVLDILLLGLYCSAERVLLRTRIDAICCGKEAEGNEEEQGCQNLQKHVQHNTLGLCQRQRVRPGDQPWCMQAAIPAGSA